MIKSITLWMVITVIGAVGLLGFLASSSPGGSAEPGEQSAAGPATSSQAVLTTQASLRALRESDASGTRSALRATGQIDAIQSWYSPRTSSAGALAVLRPDSPPTRGTVGKSAPARSALRADALNQLTRALQDHLSGAGIALLLDVREDASTQACEGDHSACGAGGVCAENNCLPALAVTEAEPPPAELTSALAGLLRKQLEAAKENQAFSGLWAYATGLYEIHAVQTTQDGLWALSAKPLGKAQIERYSTALAKSSALYLVRDKKEAVSILPEGLVVPAALKTTLDGIDASKDFAQSESGIAVLTLPALNGSPAALVVYTPAGSAAGGAPAGTAVSASGGVFDRLSNIPDHPVPLVLTAVGVLLIGLLLGFVTRREATSYAQTGGASLIHAHEADSGVSLEKFEELQGENSQLKNRFEEVESSTKQLNNQLEYARGEIEKKNDELNSAHDARDQALKEVEGLRARLLAKQGGSGASTSISEVVAAVGAPSQPPPQPPKRRKVKKPGPPGEEFDTAEVSGEEMSQLLEGIDAPEDIGSLADELEGMSDAEAAQLKIVSPIAIPDKHRDDPTSEEIDREFLDMVESFGNEVDSMLAGDDVTTDQGVVEAPAPADVKPIGAGSLDGVNPRGTMPGLPRIKSEDIEEARRRTPGTGEDKDTARDTITDAPPTTRDPRGDTSLGFARRKNSTSPGLPLFSREARKDSQPTAPPPWKSVPKRGASAAGASGGAGLSPASLLEALKRRGQASSESPTNPGSQPPTEDTKISPVTRELLEKSKRKAPRTVSRSGLFSRTGSKVGAEPSSDSEYFKGLFEEFLATKQKCGESTENITLERFVNRLARNKQALMERYDCRTVRFQVYVKEGRAALKATPVK